MQNTDGPNFEALRDLPGLILLNGKQVDKLMNGIKESILQGTENVIKNMPNIDDKIVRVAMRSLTNSFEYISEQFGKTAAGGSMGGTDLGGDWGVTDVWTPKLFSDAVCCMEGMDCWTGAFANTQGKLQLEAELAGYKEQLPALEAHFDELNLENVQKAAAELAIAFADTRERAAKLTQQQKDAAKREELETAKLAGLTGDALTAQ